MRVPCIPSRFDGTSTPPRTRLAPALPPDRGEAGCLRVGRAPVAEAVKPWASVFTELDLAAGGIPRLGVQPCWPSFRGIGAACTMSICAPPLLDGGRQGPVWFWFALCLIRRARLLFGFFFITVTQRHNHVAERAKRRGGRRRT